MTGVAGANKYTTTSLDAIATALYSEAMNDSRQDPTAQDDAPPQGGGKASLFGFLAAAEQLRARIAEALASVGLSYPKYELLRHIHDAGGPLTLGILAEGQGCARSNITQLMDRLEAEGLVRRIHDPNDRRSVLAELTPAGEAKALEGVREIERVRAEFAASFTGSEREQLARLLGKIV